jgi:hypothetical protein
VVRLVGDGRVRREADVVVSLERDDVGEEIASGECEVLDDKVERLVGVLDTRDRDVSNLGN